MTTGRFLVILRESDGRAVLATRRAFATREQAQAYAAGCAPGYNAEVVESLPVIIGRPGED